LQIDPDRPTFGSTNSPSDKLSILAFTPRLNRLSAVSERQTASRHRLAAHAECLLVRMTNPSSAARAFVIRTSPSFGLCSAALVPLISWVDFPSGTVWKLLSCRRLTTASLKTDFGTSPCASVTFAATSPTVALARWETVSFTHPLTLSTSTAFSPSFSYLPRRGNQRVVGFREVQVERKFTGRAVVKLVGPRAVGEASRKRHSGHG